MMSMGEKTNDYRPKVGDALVVLPAAGRRAGEPVVVTVTSVARVKFTVQSVPDGTLPFPLTWIMRIHGGIEDGSVDIRQHLARWFTPEQWAEREALIEADAFLRSVGIVFQFGQFTEPARRIKLAALVREAIASGDL